MLIVVAAIIVALALELRDSTPGRVPGSPGASPTPSSDLGALRLRAALPPCPPDGSGAGPQSLRGVMVHCLSDGATVDAARSVAGRPVLLNLWAYWCEPCAQELPALAEYQQRVGNRITVITVHQDDDAAAALSRLVDWGVKLPTWQDGQRHVAAALGVPSVMPTSVILRTDGSVARILPRAFASADEVIAAVDQTMGAPG